MYFIELEDLVANSLIELNRIDKTKDFISYKNAEEYGNVIINVLKSQKKRAKLVLSRERTYNFLCEYSDFFEEYINVNGEIGVKIKNGKTSSDLIRQFRGTLGLDVLRAMTSKEAINYLRSLSY